MDRGRAIDPCLSRRANLRPLRLQWRFCCIDLGSLWFDPRIFALTLWHLRKSRNAH
jgi:hypothetical protein